MDESEIVQGQFLKPRGDRAALLEPPNGAFDDIAGTVGSWFPNGADDPLCASCVGDVAESLCC